MLRLFKEKIGLANNLIPTILAASTTIWGLSTILAIKPAIAQNCGTKSGHSLPCWRDYLDIQEGNESLPFYPYAKRPNGCSIPFVKSGKYDNFLANGYNFNFREVCNQHDRCYFTLGTTPNQCNTPLAQNLKKVCQDGLGQNIKPGDTTAFLGISGQKLLAYYACEERAKWMSESVISGQKTYHSQAQTIQRDYLRKVEEYLRKR